MPAKAPARRPAAWFLKGGWWSAIPTLTMLVLLGPIAIGFTGTLLPASGYLPAVGARTISLQPFVDAVGGPGFWTSLRLSLFVGVASAGVSFMLAGCLVALSSRKQSFRVLELWSLPLLAVPHASLAIGLAFLIAPTGFLLRILTPWATGTMRPPTDLVTVNDPYGFALILGLVIKETPFLVVMMLQALPIIAWRQQVRAAQSLGVSQTQALLKVVAPQIWAPLRLPVYAVIAYGLANLDQAQVLGPSQPGSLAILTVRLFSDYDVTLYPRAAALSVIQLALVVGVLGAAYALEQPVWALTRAWIERGGRGEGLDHVVRAGAIIGIVMMSTGLASLFLLVVWSFASQWPFPDVWPRELSLFSWSQAPTRLWGPIATTLIVAGVSTAIALVLAVLSLEALSRAQAAADIPLPVIYLPLIVPQVAFLFGLQVALVAARLEGTLAAVVLLHIIFVLPYVLLALARTWAAVDPRYARSAASLGAGPLSVLLTVKIPMLAGPLLWAAAVGIAVSVGQYLPTLIAGAGRVTSLTTEALTLAGGADRRLLGVLGVLQAVIPLLAFGLALGLSAGFRRNRRGLA